MIDKKTYINFSDEGFSILPLVREVQAQGDTPISLYLKIANQQNTFLLESVEGGDKWAQYSVIGFGCKDSIKIAGNTVEKSLGGQKEVFNQLSEGIRNIILRSKELEGLEHKDNGDENNGSNTVGQDPVPF